MQANPDAEQAGIQQKEIVDGTVQKILGEANNKLLVYDNTVVKYYMHPDSYLSISRANNIPNFVIGIDVPEAELIRRIKDRGIDASRLLDDLPVQLQALAVASADIHPDFMLTDARNTASLQLLDAQLRRIMDSH